MKYFIHDALFLCIFFRAIAEYDLLSDASARLPDKGTRSNVLPVIESHIMFIIMS